jgi:hypothetical protein
LKQFSWVKCGEALPETPLFTSKPLLFLVDGPDGVLCYAGHYHCNGWFYGNVGEADKTLVSLAWGREDAVHNGSHPIEASEGIPCIAWAWLNE